MRAEHVRNGGQLDRGVSEDVHFRGRPRGRHAPGMEKWEHVLVQLVQQPIAQLVMKPTQMDLAMEDLPPSLDSVIRVVNQLGDRGWQLVSADGVGPDGRTGTFWLKRSKR